jgi:hypothetical protein
MGGLTETLGALLSTPDAYAGDRGGSQDPGKRREGGHSVALQDVTEHLLPTPKASDGEFATPSTSGRPPERATFLSTRIIRGNEIDLLSTGGHMNLPSGDGSMS